MNKIQLEELRKKIHKEIMDEMLRYLEETGQKNDENNTEFGKGFSFAMGAACGIVTRVISQEKKEPDEPSFHFQIWSEGFETNGEKGQATLHGVGFGKDFKEACQYYARHNPVFEKNFDSDRMTYWGCRLFDNEEDARRTFG
ncbi:hypothetical protein [Cytobacillus oceanisediminis]|uniref:hypothetical protein n=1 Tax=Cytobacillus oceanisediminis TaxID=665099 RepID=UPI001FB42685|nr:hypothetical protein [Cytobacillus oceanisediminis]UOE58024.1 hypothetical protein IRB79_27560 [Cytobacillus oceanisediminis]